MHVVFCIVLLVVTFDSKLPLIYLESPMPQFVCVIPLHPFILSVFRVILWVSPRGPRLSWCITALVTDPKG